MSSFIDGSSWEYDTGVASIPIDAAGITASDLDTVVNEAFDEDLWLYLKWGDVDVVFNDSRLSTQESFGGEGEGDDYWVVVRLVSKTGEFPTRYFHKGGYYRSYDGGYLDQPLREVAPVQKTVTVYE